MAYPKLKGQSALAPTRHWAHWSFTQRTIRVILADKLLALKQNMSILYTTKTLGKLLVAKRKEAGLIQQKLAEIIGFHHYWLGRLERGWCMPSVEEWSRLRTILPLPLDPQSL